MTLGTDSTHCQSEDPRLAISIYFNRIFICGLPGVGKMNFTNLLLKDTTTVSSQQSTLAKSILSVAKNVTSFEKMDDVLLDVVLGTIKQPSRIDTEKLELFSTDEVQSTLLIPKRKEPAPNRQVSSCEKYSTLQNQKSPHGKEPLVLNWYQCIRSGGQSKSCQLLSTIIPKPSLRDKLNDHPKVEAFINVGNFTTHQSALLNSKILMQDCAALEQTEIMDNHIKLLIAGTYRNIEDQCSRETMDDKNQQIMKRLMPSINPVTLNNEGNELTISVNSSQSNEDDEKAIDEIQKKLLEMRHKVKPTNVRFRWLKFYQEIIKDKSVQIIRFNELFEIAKEYDIKDLEEFLDTFHDFHAILYYPQVLPSVVFTDPQVLLDLITQVIEVVALSDMDHLIQAACCEGIISIELLDFVASRYPNSNIYKENVFQPHDFINILLHLKVITKCNWKSEAEYFMPTLLKELDIDAIARELSSGTGSAAPLIMFLSINERSWIKRGAFYSIVTSLLLFENWKIASNSENKPLCIYFNCIKLLATGCVVTLVDQVACIEIYITAPNVELYQQIYSDIRKSTVDQACLIGTSCPCMKSSVSSHLAFFSDQTTLVACSQDPRKMFLLSSIDADGKLWFETTGKLLLLPCNPNCNLSKFHN